MTLNTAGWICFTVALILFLSFVLIVTVSIYLINSGRRTTSEVVTPKSETIADAIYYGVYIFGTLAALFFILGAVT